jgi:hypothetical protein
VYFQISLEGVVAENSDNIRFDHVAPGDFFEYNGLMCLKINGYGFRGPQGQLFQAVIVKSGSLLAFRCADNAVSEELVRRVKNPFHIVM